MARTIRILYAGGPGDVVGTYRHWKAGRDDPSQVAISYSGQFYDLCRELGAKGYVISYHPRRERVVDENLIIEHRRLWFGRGPAALYHLGQLWYGIRLVISAIRFRADVAVVADGTHWFVLGWMGLAGVKVIPSLHCVLWPKGRAPRGRIKRLIQRWNARFFRKRAAAVLSLSEDITQQVRELTGTGELRIFSFLPNYRREAFEGFGDPPARPPFRVFFAGRIERNKGVFELLELAKGFEQRGEREIEFDLCGDGSQLDNLRQAARDAGVSERFRCHGHSDKTVMREMFQRCQVVIVPTTTEFIEGFNKVVAEGVLAGRPVITSSVCPALEYVREAVVEVPADDTKAYGEAISRLKNDIELYLAKRRGCLVSQEQFYDLMRGWKSALNRAIESLSISHE